MFLCRLCSNRVCSVLKSVGKIGQTPFGGKVYWCNEKLQDSVSVQAESLNSSVCLSQVWGQLRALEQTNRAFIIFLSNGLHTRSLLGHEPVLLLHLHFFPPHKNSVYLISKAHQGHSMQTTISASSSLLLFISFLKRSSSSKVSTNAISWESNIMIRRVCSQSCLGARVSLSVMRSKHHDLSFNNGKIHWSSHQLTGFLLCFVVECFH